jgi:hypothetical protein
VKLVRDAFTTEWGKESTAFSTVFAASKTNAGASVILLNETSVDLDIVGEEHGHTHQFQGGFVNTITGSTTHAAVSNERTYNGRGIDEGRKIAFDEGAAQFLAAAAKQHIPRPFLDDPLVFHGASIEDPIGGRNGEDNELSVRQILWDLYDGPNENSRARGYTEAKDQVQIAKNKLWTFLSGGPHVLGDVWTHFAPTVNDKVPLGGVFQTARVSPAPLNVSGLGPDRTASFVFANPKDDDGDLTHDVFTIHLIGTNEDGEFEELAAWSPSNSGSGDYGDASQLLVRLTDSQDQELDSLTEDQDKEYFWTVSGSYSGSPAYWGETVPLEPYFQYLYVKDAQRGEAETTIRPEVLVQNEFGERELLISPMTFDWGYSPGTATGPPGTNDYPKDYSFNEGSRVGDWYTGELTAPAGVDLIFLPEIVPVNDSTFEPDETIVVSIGKYSFDEPYFWANRDTGVITLKDDDGPAIRITDVVVAEGQGNAVFSVILGSPASDPLTVQYATQDDTANQGSDYQNTSGQLRFQIGDTAKRVEIPITDDMILESTETFRVLLSQPSFGGFLSAEDKTGTATIIDNEPGLRISGYATPSIQEGTGNFGEAVYSGARRTL